MKKTGENLLFMVHSGFLYRQQYFTTGFIDLTQNIELIRKGLESKWRNALKNAEKRNIIIENICSLDVFNIVLEKHILDKNKRNYKDSGDLITRYLFENGYMTGFLARSEKEEIISFVLLALHENTGTYYIGWSNEEGYKVNASRLLVWKMIMYLKENGYIWFDLGGLDYIHTKSVAEFRS